MATFSWSDNLKIVFRSCSPCLWPLHNKSINNNNNNDEDDDEDGNGNGNDNEGNSARSSRSGELHGLLADNDSDAERMSLHSNPGSKKRRRSRKNHPSSSGVDDDSHDDDHHHHHHHHHHHRRRRGITLFGYNLFGRPPIQLADDSEDALYNSSHHRRRRTRRASHTELTPSTTRSSTFDSDAAPLDIETIAALSSPTTAAAVIDNAAADKEERRRKRRERKELKRMAGLLAAPQLGDGEQEFEGFQGSGSGDVSAAAYHRPRIPERMLAVSDSTPKVTAQVNDNDEEADFDGSHYAQNTSGGSHRGSDDTRSRTSASLSDRPPHAESSLEKKKKKKRPKDDHRSSSSRTAGSSSSTTTTTSTSSPRQMVSPSTVEQGQGFFDLEEDDEHAPPPPPVSNSSSRPDSGYLPITGFGGGTPASSRVASHLGAILAQRGNN